MCRSRDDYLNRGLAPEGELLSFASPKESNQRKGDPVAACFLCSSLLQRVSRRGSCPSADVRHPCRTPHGLFSAKAPVLGAANGIEFVPLASFHRHLIHEFKRIFVSYGTQYDKRQKYSPCVTSAIYWMPPLSR